jgi:hypothetical protein
MIDAETVRHLARLERLHADRRVDDDADDGVGLRGRDLLDLHAACRRGDDDDALGAAVHDEREVELLGDVGRFLDVEARDKLAAGTGLVRHELLAEQVFRRALDLGVVRAHADAARLAARARMDLRLHDPLVAADLGGAIGRLLGAVGEAAAGDRNAVPMQQLLRLVFVDVHFLELPRLKEVGFRPLCGRRPRP